MNRRVLVALLSVLLLGLLAACSGAPTESTGANDEALTCTEDDDCIHPHPPIITKSYPTPTSLPGCAAGAGTCNGVCDPGYASCTFSESGNFIDGSGTLPCTEAYLFDEANSVQEWKYYVAYCVDTSDVESWVSAHAPPAADQADTTKKQRALATSAGLGYVFVQYQDLNIIKCKQGAGGCIVDNPGY